MSALWYCAETRVGKTRLAIGQLARQHFVTFNPVTVERRFVRHEPVEFERPLFPGYLFIQFDRELPGWQRINGTIGVKRLICASEDMPIPMPEWAMAELLVERPVVDFTKLELFKRGERLAIEGGPFSGFTGAVEFSDRERVVVLLSIFGRQTRATVDRSVVRRLN